MFHFKPLCMILLLTAFMVFLLPANTYGNMNYEVKPESTISLCNEDFSLILIGVVFDETYRWPVSNLTIQLVDVFEERSETCTSKLNGQFHFYLHPDRVYKINILDSNNSVISSTDFSTINRLEPELMRVFLTLPSGKQ